jgi:hypothetical protein
MMPTGNASKAIGRSSAVAILIGKHGIGNTQQYERELALVRQTRDVAFPVIPVLMPGCDSPPTGFLQLLTWVDLSKGEDRAARPVDHVPDGGGHGATRPISAKASRGTEQ